MLHTILLILKIIGIALAIIVGIILVLIAMILFVPVTYKIDGVKNTDTGQEELIIYLSWLVRVFHGHATYKDKKLTSATFLLGRKLKPKMRWRNIKVVKYVEEKAREIIKKKYTFQEFCDIIKMLPDATVGLYEFLSNHTHQAAFRVFKREFMIFWQYLKPKTMDLELLYGSEDPYETGKFMAIMSVLYAWYGDSINVQADYEHNIWKGETHIKGRVCIYWLVVFIFRLYFDESVLKTYQDLEKIADA